MLTTNPSLARRAALALALMIGFYGLALTVALGLLYFAYADIVYARHAFPKLIFFAVIGGLTILWSILPRWDRFVPPGPTVRPERHPRLFELVRGVAVATGQAMPAEVYLIPNVNAFVSTRGGVIGIGSRRVMGLGLPLMQLLSVAEFRGVIAHEFGHFYGGDTRLGPWIYKTRQAIGRTLKNLGDGILQKPFAAYGELFMTLTQSVSRAQEYAADALGARIVGAPAMISGLRSVRRGAAAFQAYWGGEVEPVLRTGYRPPIAVGFSQFMGAARVAESTNEALEDDLRHSLTDPSDTHPTLRDRIAALARDEGGNGATAAESNGARAITLLDDLGAAEKELLQFLYPASADTGFIPLDWSDLLPKVYLPAWRAHVAPHAAVLAGIRLRDLPDLMDDRNRFTARFREGLKDHVPVNQHWEAVRGIVSAAYALVLHERGFPFSVKVGEPVLVRVGPVDVDPWRVEAELSKSDTRAQWRKFITDNALADAALANG